MMNDPHRMAPFDAAIRSMVQPGDVVLDLGASGEDALSAAIKLLGRHPSP